MIKEICGSRGVPYVALPPNPERNPSRSHGIAMNWTYYNLIQHAEPAMFEFIDHDCFPIAEADIPARMAQKIAYGRKWASSNHDRAWHLWAGFCFFRFDAAKASIPDFKPLRRLGLDTGGANWPRLYSRLAPEEVEVASERMLDMPVGDVDTLRKVFDERFLHLGGTSYRGKFSAADYRKLVADHIWATYLVGANRLVP